MTDDEIDRKIEAWQNGDSNDEEIDGLTEIVRDLQEERVRLWDALEKVPVPDLRDPSVFWDAWEAAKAVLPKERQT